MLFRLAFVFSGLTHDYTVQEMIIISSNKYRIINCVIYVVLNICCMVTLFIIDEATGLPSVPCIYCQSNNSIMNRTHRKNQPTIDLYHNGSNGNFTTKMKERNDLIYNQTEIFKNIISHDSDMMDRTKILTNFFRESEYYKMKNIDSPGSLELDPGTVEEIQPMKVEAEVKKYTDKLSSTSSIELSSISYKLHSLAEEISTFTGRQLEPLYGYYYLERKLWYIPLYFSIYFVFYIGSLVLKAISRHRIYFPQTVAAAVPIPS